MKYLLIILFLLSLAGCKNIRHKSFRTILSGAGGKFSVADPSGTGSPTPTIIIGAYTQSITTIPPGTKAKYTSKSYELFSGHLLFEESMDIETTVHGEIEITDNSAQYKNNEK